MILKGEYISFHILVHPSCMFRLPHRAQASQFSVVLYCYIVQTHWRLTYKTPGIQESIIALLTLLFHPPLFAFVPSLINRPALRAPLCSEAHIQFVCLCVGVHTECRHCVYAYLHTCRCMGVFACVQNDGNIQSQSDFL